MGAILSVSSSDLLPSIISYFLCFINHYLSRQFIKKKITKMKTELKTTTYHHQNDHSSNNCSTDRCWSTGSDSSLSSSSSASFPYGQENKENSANGYNSIIINWKETNRHLNTPQKLIPPTDKNVNFDKNYLICQYSQQHQLPDVPPFPNVNSPNLCLTTKVNNPKKTQNGKVPFLPTSMTPTSTTVTIADRSALNGYFEAGLATNVFNMPAKTETKSGPDSNATPENLKNNLYLNPEDKRNMNYPHKPKKRADQHPHQPQPNSGSSRSFRLLHKKIEEAVRNFSWNSGYVHEKGLHPTQPPAPGRRPHPQFSPQRQRPCNRNPHQINPYFPTPKAWAPYFQTSHCIAASLFGGHQHHGDKMRNKNIRRTNNNNNPKAVKKGGRPPPFWVDRCPTVGLLGPQPAAAAPSLNFDQFDRPSPRAVHQPPPCKSSPSSPWWWVKSSKGKHQERFKRTHWFCESMKKANCNNKATVPEGVAAAKDLAFFTPPGARVDIFDIPPPQDIIITQEKATTTTIKSVPSSSSSLDSSSSARSSPAESPKNKKSFIFLSCESKDKQKEEKLLASRALQTGTVLADNNHPADLVGHGQDEEIYLVEESGCSLVSGSIRAGCTPSSPIGGAAFLELDDDDDRDGDGDGLILFMSPSLSSSAAASHQHDDNLYPVGAHTDEEDEEEEDSEVDGSLIFENDLFSSGDDDDDEDDDDDDDEIDGYCFEESSSLSSPSPTPNCFILASSWAVQPSSKKLHKDYSDHNEEEEEEEEVYPSNILDQPEQAQPRHPNNPRICSISVSSRGWAVKSSTSKPSPDDDHLRTIVNRDPNPKPNPVAVTTCSVVSVSGWAIKPDDDDCDDDVDDWDNTWSHSLTLAVKDNNNNNSDNNKDEDDSRSGRESIKGGGGSVTKCLEGLDKADGVGDTGRHSSLDNCLPQPAITPFLSSSSSSSSLPFYDDDDYFYDDEEERRKVEEANQRWDAFYNNDINDRDNDCNDDDDDTRLRKVGFVGEENLVRVHLMLDYPEESHSARVGPWISLSLATRRFHKRINDLTLVLDPVLDKEHRKKILTSRFPELVTEEMSEKDSEE